MRFVSIKYIALIAVAVIGLERVNVMPWSGSFIQPYYLLAAPFLLYLWKKPLHGFGGLVLVLLAVMAASMLGNGLYDAYYWKKFVMVTYILLASYGLAIYLVTEKDTVHLAKGLMLFLLLNVAITFLQMDKFFQGSQIGSVFDANQYVNFAPVLIGDYFRLSGYSFDTNKGIFNFGYALIFLTLIAETGWLWLKALYPLTFLAHSRSTLISMLPAIFKKSKGYAVVYIGLYVLVLIFLTPLDILNDRLYSDGGSNQTRLELIRKWWELMVQSSWLQVLLGHGFASSGKYLQNLLGTAYSDFACGYLTIMYELGVAGVILIGTLFVRLWRMFGETERGMLLLPLMVFQLFYANLAEPMVLLTLSYFYLRTREEQPSPKIREH